ncbi:MAG TPA: glycine betaine ABC transporter substrate-binding protein [Fimbriimonadaceae bacterium]|nr:glycine betaine ABC transporter substrate-binding protein [Fimbriimonadaceae bacterium]
MSPSRAKEGALLAFLLSLLLPALGLAQTHLTVGSKKFTESFVLGEIARGLLQKQGYKVTHKQGMGATLILWGALKGGSIDVYPEYTGTIEQEILKSKDHLSSEQMRAALSKEGIGMTDELGFNNTYTLVMEADKAKALGITKISDLKAHQDLPCGPTIEFLGRKDGWKPLMAKYGIAMQSAKGIEHKLGYTALESGSIAVKDAYSTDADIETKHLTSLKDDLGFFPKYRAVYLYRLGIPAKAVKALNSIAGTIDEPEMIKLNAAAESSKNYVAAANQYFEEHKGVGVKSVEATNVWSELLAQAGQHLILVGVSLALAVLFGIPLGIRAAKPGAVSAVILGATGLIQTVPSLALFAILVPWLGTEPRTAVLALFLYSLLPIVRNTATGLSGIAPSLRESAAALGLDARARLFKVELPLASPTILAGIKVSAVINVGTATIAAFIGAGGLGQSIQTGLALSDKALILRGGIAAAVLALIVQLLFEGVDRLLIPKGLRLPPAP